MSFKHSTSHSNIFEIHGHLQFKLLTRIYFGGSSEFSPEPQDPDTTSDDWGLVDACGQRYLLPKTMLFMGREECDIVVQSQTVDKRHAVITFDHYLNKFKIKDLSTVNGTYVNDSRIQDQEYVTLKHMDSVRLGSDSMVYYMEQIEEKSTISLEDDINIPPPPTMPAWATRELASLAECEGCIAEQKLCHTCGGTGGEVCPVEEVENEVHIHTSYHRDKSKDSNTWPRKRVRNTQNIATFFTDQNSFDDSDSGPNRVLRGESSIPENLPPELETVKKGTPLYGQPDWWGEDDSNDKDSSTEKPSNLSVQNNVGTNDSSPPSEIDNSKGSSLSKDSLLCSQTGEMDTPESPDKASVPASSVTPKPSDGSTSMAFTVEFDDESPKMNISGKLEDFMPSKVRRSFRGRSDKQPKTSEDSSKEEKSSVRGSSPPRQKSSSRGSSPARQKKIDELWESSEKPRKNVRRNSSGASDHREESKTSQSIKDLNTHKRKLSSGGLTRSKSLKAKENDIKLDPEVNESASYLIDKMFSSGTKTATTKSPTKSPKSDRFTEHALYREAKLYEFGKENAKDNVASKKQSRQSSKKKPVENPEPVNVSPVEISKKQVEDNVSESGTYTIEADDSISKDEEEKARENIDKAFGLDKDYLPQTSTEPGIKSQKCLKNDELEVEDIEDQIEELEKVRAHGPEAESLDVEVGSDVLTELKIVEDGETNNDMKSTEPSTWMTQWAALTSKSNKSPSNEMASPRSNPDDLKSPHSIRKPPSGSKKRPGTGRKLPRLPNDKGSPSGSETSSRMSERSSKLSEGTTSPRCPSTPNDGSKKIVTISDRVVNRYDDTDTETVSKTKFETDSESNFTRIDSEGEKTPQSSRSSGVSIDTDILLKDTAHVVAAVESKSKKSSQSKPLQNGHVYSYMNGSGKARVNGDYHDSESMVALINGDEEFEKPSDYGSPRENLAKSTKAKNKKPLTRVYSTSAAQRLQKFKENSFKRTLSTGDQSSVSDVLSESDTSVADLSLDLSTFEDTEINRKGSKGKGTVTLTRPNRAFQLRRQRADGDVPTTPGSDISESTSFTGVSKVPSRNARTPTTGSSRTSKTPTSSLRSLGSRTPTGVSSNNSLSFTKSVSSRQSWHGSSSKPDLTSSSSTKGRNSGSDRQYDSSARSEVSLGAQIVSKSQANIRGTNITRTDLGRHSLKLNKSLSTLDNSSTDVRKSDLRSFKNRLKTTQSYGLSVTGVGNKNTSQPSSRTNSPKSAEKAAWKRRKEYDPRRAVAEAKTKVKDKGNPTSALTSIKRMTRSASFTNTAELGGRYRKDKSVSLYSTDNVSIASVEGNDTFDDSSIASSHRGFIPYSGRSQSSHLYKNSDDEELSIVAKSSQSYDNILVSSIYQLSDKLQSKTNHVVHRLRKEDRLMLNSPSPIDDIIDQSMNSDMPAWKSANQELAGILSNLRKIEHHLRCLNRVIFPGEVSPSDSSMSGKEKQEYLQEIERIRSELAGFQPIANKEDTWKLRHDDESVESDCEELGGPEEFF